MPGWNWGFGAKRDYYRKFGDHEEDSNLDAQIGDRSGNPHQSDGRTGIASLGNPIDSAFRCNPFDELTKPGTAASVYPSSTARHS
jgi:hypothetical protein